MSGSLEDCLQGAGNIQIKRNILLNPGPATTTDSVKLAQVVPDICPREQEFAKIMQDMREDLVRIVHGNPKEYTSVLFCGSGTICMDVCLNSLLPPNKKVLVINNGAYSTRAVEICRAYNLPHIDLTLPKDKPADLTAVEEALRLNPDIALVYVTHNETGTGLLNPIRDIGTLAHKHNAVFVTDTTSTYAMLPIDVIRDNIDICMASAQKGIMATTGLSFVIGKREVIERSAKYPVRSYYCNLFMQYDGFERTGEMRFTPPVQTVYAARQGIKEYFAEGEDKKWARHTRVYQALHRGLDTLGFRDVIRKEDQAGLVISVLYPDDPNWDFKRIHDDCYDSGFTIYPGKIAGTNTFRLCALGAIDELDIDSFFKVFRKALEQSNVTIPVIYSEKEQNG